MKISFSQPRKQSSIQLVRLQAISIVYQQPKTRLEQKIACFQTLSNKSQSSCKSSNTHKKIEPAVKQMKFRQKRGTKMKQLMSKSLNEDLFWKSHFLYFESGMNFPDSGTEQDEDYQLSSQGADSFDSDFGDDVDWDQQAIQKPNKSQKNSIGTKSKSTPFHKQGEKLKKIKLDQHQFYKKNQIQEQDAEKKHSNKKKANASSQLQNQNNSSLLYSITKSNKWQNLNLANKIRNKQKVKATTEPKIIKEKQIDQANQRKKTQMDLTFVKQ